MSAHNPYAWHAANNGVGKFIWFVTRKATGCEKLSGAGTRFQNSSSSRYLDTPAGQLRRFASRDAALRIADAQNRAEGRA